MNGRPIRTAAVSILLLFALIWLAGPILRVPGPDAGKDLLLPGFPERPEGIVLTNDSLDARLEPDGAGWRIVRPVEDRADSAEVDRILSLLKHAPRVRVVDPAPGPDAPYGLDPPRATVRAAGRTIRIGLANPTRDGVYLSLPPDSSVLLGGTSFAALPALRIGKLRSRRPLHFPYREVERVAVHRRGKTATLRRTGRNSWFAEEAGLRANADAAWRILAHLKDGRVHGWLDRGEYRPGNDPVLYRVGWPEGEASITVGAEYPETALRTALAPGRSGTILLPRRIVDSLENWAGAMLDPLLFGGDPAAAESVFVEGERGAFTLLAVEEGWTIRPESEAPEEADPSRTRAFLRSLARLKADRFLSPEDAAEKGTVLLRVRTGGEAISLERRGGGALVGRRAGEEGALLLEAGAAGPAGIRADRLAARRLFPDRIRRAGRVRIVFGGFELRALREDEGWRIEEPVPGVGRAEAFDELLGRLAGLRWAAHAEESALPDGAVLVEVDGEGESWSIRFTPGPAPVLAEAGGKEGLVELPADPSAWIPERLGHWRLPTGEER